MLCEVCYRALSSIVVVEATHGRVARGRGVSSQLVHAGLPGPVTPALAGVDQTFSDFAPPLQDSLAGGPPARWFVILRYDSVVRRALARRLVLSLPPTHKLQ